MERPNAVTLKGNPLTLIGNEINVGDTAPNFSLLDTSLGPVTLDDSRGKVRLFSVAPSLDTPVCDIQTVTFNKKAAELGDDVALYSVSVDLPFAAKRFCTEKSVDKVKTLSDHRDTNFGQAYGLLIKELRLLGRAVIVVDKDDKVVYKQVVKEIGDQPDYEAALTALKQALGK